MPLIWTWAEVRYELSLKMAALGWRSVQSVTLEGVLASCHSPTMLFQLYLCLLILSNTTFLYSLKMPGIPHFLEVPRAASSTWQAPPPLLQSVFPHFCLSESLASFKVQPAQLPQSCTLPSPFMLPGVSGDHGGRARQAVLHPAPCGPGCMTLGQSFPLSLVFPRPDSQ